MSDVASQLVLHPVISQSIKVLATTLGRDKLYRTVQYFARFLAWFLLARGFKLEAARWNSLKAALASGRKLMRLFKPLEHLQAALRASQLSSLRAYPIDQYTTIARQLSYAGYLSLDAIVWLNSVRFLALPPTAAAKVNKASQRFWLSGILFSIVHGLVKVARLANEAKRLRSISEKGVGADADRLSRAQALDIDRINTRYQLIQDSFDFFLPASNLGLVNVNDGVAGIIGVITSVMALQLQWKAVGKTMGK
ncbi:Peroxisomal membrane protein PMP27 [Ceratobasidium sp. UAMH 11750]|nr:Peroxisomal membrane protein PMP27 [Ceratobasidium sp. UAMH 11750]